MAKDLDIYTVKVPLDPSPRQIRQFKGYAGAARFAYNAGLAHLKEQYEERKRQKEAGIPEEEIAKFDSSQGYLSAWWRSSEIEWRTNYPSRIYDAAFNHLATAFTNFYKSRSGKRKGARMGFPTFKKRSSRKTFSFARDAHLVGDFGIHFPRIEGIVHTLRNVRKLVNNRETKTMTVSYENGRWYVSINCVTDMPTLNRSCGKSIGVDLGLKELATLSDGTVIHNPKPLHAALRDLAHAQRSLARKDKGSINYEKQREKVDRLYGRIKHLRTNAINELTAYLVKEYADICIEDLNVAGMKKNHSLAQAISDASFGEIRRQLEYKAKRTGARIHVVDRFYPSSKRCSQCGYVKKRLLLSERVYVCEQCGMHMDRDLNAAKNIEQEGMRIFHS